MGNSPGMMIDPNGEMTKYAEPVQDGDYAVHGGMDAVAVRQFMANGAHGMFGKLLMLGMNTILTAANGGGGNSIAIDGNNVYTTGSAAQELFAALFKSDDLSESQTANTASGNNYNSGSISPVENVQPNDGNVVFPDESKTESIYLYIWDVASTNSKEDLGHTAIRIGNKIYGYYPTTSIYNSPGDLRVDDVDKFKFKYQGNMITSYEVKLHPSMTLALTQKMNQAKQSPGSYSVLFLNCTSFAVGMLQKIAIYIYVNESNCLSPYPIDGIRMTPQQLNRILERDYNRDVFINRTRFQVTPSMR